MKKNISFVRLVQHFLSIATCTLMLMAVVVQRDARLFGYDLQLADIQSDSVVTRLDDGTLLIATAPITADIIGYGGRVPLEITIERGVVSEIEVLRNAETPRFLRTAEKVLPRFVGLTPEKILNTNVDAVSGATYTSSAIITSVYRGMEYVVNNGKVGSSQRKDFSSWLSAEFICSLIVVLLGAILPLFFKNKIYRIVQLLLNVVILGFWSGTFLNYTALLSFFSNGINWVTSIVLIVMMVVAFVYPLLNHPNHYCMWICPFGSIQELMGRIVPYKVRISPRLLRGLDLFRQILWAVLMLLMWTGVWFDWIDYELFSAFFLSDAVIGVLIAAVVVLLLSTIVSRPYCRFVCPTGCLMRTAELSNAPQKTNAKSNIINSKK